MSFSVDKVVPWGRNFDEYVSMFSLSDNDLESRLVGCADGPASFNTELTRRGGDIISVDPIYSFSALEIRERIETTYDLVMEQTRDNKDGFVWNQVDSVEELGRIRMLAMNLFLEDYQIRNDNYVPAELPIMPFADNNFDLALCSHFLFLYSEHLTSKFHIQSIKELCRIASEARIFPLLEFGSKKSRHLEKVIGTLVNDGYECSVEKVSYEFQKNGNEMLRVKSGSQ